jgi:hypothetical protein
MVAPVAPAPTAKKSGTDPKVLIGIGAAVVVFDVPKSTDVESIELHDGPFSDGCDGRSVTVWMTCGLARQTAGMYPL